MTEDIGPRQRAAQTKRTRTEGAIKQAAAKLLRVCDYDQLRMEDIASEAGVSTATLYNYFRTKNVLVIAAYVDSLEAVVLKYMHDVGPSRYVPDALRNYLTNLAWFTSSSRTLAQAYLIAIMDQSVDVAIVSERLPFVDAFQGMLAPEHEHLPLPDGIFFDEFINYHALGMLMYQVREPRNPPERTANFVFEQMWAIITA